MAKIGFKSLIVARQEFLNGVRARWFLFSTFGLPILLAGVIGLAVVLAVKQSDKQMLLVVVDESGFVYDKLTEQFSDQFKDGAPKFEIENAAINSLAPAETILKQLRQRVLERDIDGYVHVPKDFVQSASADFFALSVSNFDLNSRLQYALSAALRDRRLFEAGVRPEDRQRVLARARLGTFRLNEQGARKDRGETFGLVYFLVILLTMTVMLYGATICRAIVEEKVSRVVEVMLASVRPFQLLAGKVLGVGSLGLLQIAVWSLFGLIVLNVLPAVIGMTGSEMKLPFTLPRFPFWLALHFLAWFILGYFLFALLFAMIASLVGSEQEAQQLQLPITVLLIIPLSSQMAIIQHPDSFYSVLLSMIPFFAPIVMFMRTAVLTPPWYEIAASMALTMLTIGMLLWVTSRIYRIGILSYGKRPSAREILRWLISG